MLGSKLGQDFTVQLNLLVGHCLDEWAVLQTHASQSGIDTVDPQRAKITLAVTTVTVLVGKGVHNSFSRFFDVRMTQRPKTLGSGQDLLVTSVTCFTSFDPSHVCKLASNQSINSLFVSEYHHGVFRILPLILSCTVRQIMRKHWLSANQLASPGNFKPLGCRFVSLDLWHVYLGAMMI